MLRYQIFSLIILSHPILAASANAGTSSVWFMGDMGSTCDQTCAAAGGECDSSMQSTLITNELVQAAFSEAGYECKSFHETRNYAGSPFSSGRTSDDCAPFKEGGEPSSCSENDGHSHQPLCFCATPEEDVCDGSELICNGKLHLWGDQEQCWHLWPSSGNETPVVGDHVWRASCDSSWKWTYKNEKLYEVSSGLCLRLSGNIHFVEEENCSIIFLDEEYASDGYTFYRVGTGGQCVQQYVNTVDDWDMDTCRSKEEAVARCDQHGGNHCFYLAVEDATTTADLTGLPSPSPSLSPTTTAVDTCDSFNCGADAAHVPNEATVEGNDFATCCRCQYGSNLLWGAHANGTFHGDSNPWSVEMWLDIPKVVTMKEIQWANVQNYNLGYQSGQATEWLNAAEGECRTRWTLAESLDTFFGTGSRFTYHKAEDRLEGMFEFKADRSMSRTVSGHEHVYVRQITQDVPVLFSLEKTATVEATFKTSVTALEYDIAITGIAEETFSENGEIVLDFNILSSSCMEQSVILKPGQDEAGNEYSQNPFVNGGITSTWSDESLWHPDGVGTASCSQDVTVTFQSADGVYDLPLVFEFQIQAADNDGEKIDQAVNLHIAIPSILDSLPIQTTMSFYLTEERTNVVGSFGLGHTVYGRIETTTVVSVDSIVLSSLVLEQMGYDNVMQTFDIMTLSWAEYQGEYPESSNKFDFSFMLKSTDLHITSSDSNNHHLASIKAAIEVTYLDGSTTNDRRQLAIAPANIDGSDASMEAMGSFAITAADEEENVAALLEITSSYKSHFLQLAAAGGFLALFLYCVRRQMKYQHESYSPLLVDDEI